MRFAAHLRTRLVLAAVCAGLCCAPLAAAAQSGTDMPDAVIPLEPLGYQPAPPIIVVAKGFSVHSLNYVDNKHLLVTWNARTLIHRMPGDPQDDSPQNLQAVLLEAPSGKVVARTVWRLADHAQYLWPVGEGTFLLRVGQQLRVLTPLSPAPDAMQGRLVMTLPGPATLVAIAPDGRMVLVESDVAKAETKTPVALPGAAPVDTQATDVQFLEFDLARQAQGIVNVNRVGHLISPSLLALPLTHEGYIHATEISPDDWDLIYTELSGKDKVLGDVVSTCPPGAVFLSNSEALVETCNGDDTAVIMTVVTLGKKELWQFTQNDAGTDPSIRTTPASGRFAVSRILTGDVNSPGVEVTELEDVRKQHIEVMDIRSGALVASVDIKPAERASQNFSLSPDGRHLAVLQGESIAIYDLAPLQDFPPAPVKPKDLVFVGAPEGATIPSLAAAAPVKTAAVAPAATAAPPSVIEVPLNVDAQRAPPTLLTPEEHKSVEGKKNKEITIQPLDPKLDPSLPQPSAKQPKEQQPQQ